MRLAAGIEIKSAVNLMIVQVGRAGRPVQGARAHR